MPRVTTAKSILRRLGGKKAIARSKVNSAVEDKAYAVFGSWMSGKAGRKFNKTDTKRWLGKPFKQLSSGQNRETKNALGKLYKRAL